MKKILIIVALIICFVNCKNKNNNNQAVQSERINVDTANIIAGNELEITDFENTLFAINTIKLPDTIYCGIDFSVPVEKYGNEIIQIAPKPSEWTSVYGKLPSKCGNEYIIYAITGDINYPYLYTYDKDGQLIDSMYLHIGPCLGDESVVISNITVINKDYSIHMTDTTKHVHYDETNKRFIDSVIVTKRELELNTESKYQIINEKRYKLYEY